MCAYPLLLVCSQFFCCAAERLFTVLKLVFNASHERFFSSSLQNFRFWIRVLFSKNVFAFRIHCGDSSFLTVSDAPSYTIGHIFLLGEYSLILHVLNGRFSVIADQNTRLRHYDMATGCCTDRNITIEISFPEFFLLFRRRRPGFCC